jgi:hypothetical protein
VVVVLEAQRFNEQTAGIRNMQILVVAVVVRHKIMEHQVMVQVL